MVHACSRCPGARVISYLRDAITCLLINIHIHLNTSSNGSCLIIGMSLFVINLKDFLIAFSTICLVQTAFCVARYEAKNYFYLRLVSLCSMWLVIFLMASF